jgi:hypothetical protein
MAAGTTFSDLSCVVDDQNSGSRFPTQLIDISYKRAHGVWLIFVTAGDDSTECVDDDQPDWT